LIFNDWSKVANQVESIIKTQMGLNVKLFMLRVLFYGLNDISLGLTPTKYFSLNVRCHDKMLMLCFSDWSQGLLT